MDDSRSVLPTGALVSRAALPSRSTTGFNFCCRVCGGGEYHVETRRGASVVLASLREYQAVGFSDLAGHHRLYTCIRCEASVREAQGRVREELLGKLLFAAKHLAERQFTRRNQYRVVELICVECRAAQVADSYLRHKGDCHVGRVMKLLHSLMYLEDPACVNEALRGFERGMLSGCGAEGSLSFPSVIAAADGGAR